MTPSDPSAPSAPSAPSDLLAPVDVDDLTACLPDRDEDCFGHWTEDEFEFVPRC